jgi:hypothetical protein
MSESEATKLSARTIAEIKADIKKKKAAHTIAQFRGQHDLAVEIAAEIVDLEAERIEVRTRSGHSWRRFRDRSLYEREPFDPEKRAEEQSPEDREAAYERLKERARKAGFIS